MEHYLEALRLKPEFPEAHNNLGRVRARQGRLDEARAHFENTLIIDPENGIARRELERLPEAP